MEIERKWMVKGWPEGLPLREEFAMRQGYISVRPTVRIREEALTGGRTDYILCFKSGGGLAREEIERSIDKELFDDLEYKIIAKPLIPKLRRSYTLPDGSVLEVNHVDEGQPTEFWYAEVEYPTVEAALAWQPESCGLGDYLKDEVTNQPGQSMGCWARPASCSCLSCFRRWRASPAASRSPCCWLQRCTLVSRCTISFLCTTM